MYHRYASYHLTDAKKTNPNTSNQRLRNFRVFRYVLNYLASATSYLFYINITDYLPRAPSPTHLLNLVVAGDLGDLTDPAFILCFTAALGFRAGD